MIWPIVLCVVGGLLLTWRHYCDCKDGIVPEQYATVGFYIFTFVFGCLSIPITALLLDLGTTAVEWLMKL